MSTHDPCHQTKVVKREATPPPPVALPIEEDHKMQAPALLILIMADEPLINLGEDDELDYDEETYVYIPQLPYFDLITDPYEQPHLQQLPHSRGKRSL